MMIRELEVYKRAFRAAVMIHESALNWPKYEIYGGLADQIRRATRGICANLAEGLAKKGEAEQRRFLNMAVGSSEEVQVWLEFAHAFGYVNGEDYKHLADEYAEIGRMLMGLMKRREG